MKRTAIYWIDGERYVFREHEIDFLLAVVFVMSDSPAEAWQLTAVLAEGLDD